MKTKKLIRELKKEWKKKCNKMETMSGDVAIFELNQILDRLGEEE